MEDKEEFELGDIVNKNGRLDGKISAKYKLKINDKEKIVYLLEFLNGVEQRYTYNEFLLKAINENNFEEELYADNIKYACNPDYCSILTNSCPDFNEFHLIKRCGWIDSKYKIGQRCYTAKTGPINYGNIVGRVPAYKYPYIKKYNLLYPGYLYKDLYIIKLDTPGYNISKEEYTEYIYEEQCFHIKNLIPQIQDICLKEVVDHERFKESIKEYVDINYTNYKKIDAIYIPEEDVVLLDE